MPLARKFYLELIFHFFVFRDKELEEKCKIECGVDFGNCHRQCDGDFICIIGCSRPLVECENGSCLLDMQIGS